MTAVMSSTAVVTPRQLVKLVVDKVVEDGRRLRIASELESVSLPDRTMRFLGSAARDAFAT